MDTATQALLGAVVGQAGFSHRLGRRAVAWGAVGGLLPDLDVVAVLTHGPFGEFLYHRGLTHALWFGPVVGPLLGWLLWRAYAARGPQPPRDGVPAGRLDPGAPAARRAWMGLFAWALFTHPLIDVFTTYGTQLLAPFSGERFALNAVGIIDPIYSGMLLVALGAGWWWRSVPPRARGAAFVALALSWAYLGYGWWLNEAARLDVTQRLAARGVEARVSTYPTLLQPYLRRVVARTDDGIFVGLYTPWRDAGPALVRFEPAPPHPLIEKLTSTREGAIFVWFAMGEVTARIVPHQGGAIVEIDDLRYGLPSTPQRGMWGIRGVFDAAGRLVGPVRRINQPRLTEGGPSLGGIWRATWGDFSAFPLAGGG